ncbi:MAG TPA: DUF2490 domain-containing protein [Bacteroidales bacterium]|nr:DUF2490 domain-containing protein [Bacteroidales bacterium]
MRKTFLFIFLFSILSGILKAQDYNTGLMPKININKKISDVWKTNLKLENQLMVSQGTTGFFKDSDADFKRTDAQFSATRKLNYKSSLTGGYMLRMDEKKPAHRLSLFYSAARKLRTLSLSHRFGVENTFKTGDNNEIRLRYRLSTAIPLNGTSIDANESYVKLSNEYVGTDEGGNRALEVRALAALGHEIGSRQKAELGLDYRRSEIGTNANVQTLWVYLGWYFKL